MRIAIDTAERSVIGDPGEWVAEHADGTRHIHSDEAFRDTYRRATIATNKTLTKPEQKGE